MKTMYYQFLDNQQLNNLERFICLDCGDRLDYKEIPEHDQAVHHRVYGEGANYAPIFTHVKK